MNDLLLGSLALYVGIGFVIALLLVRRGTAVLAAASALLAWPLLLPLSSPPLPEPSPVAPGPMRDPIDQAFLRLDQAAREARAPTEQWQAELSALRGALLRADSRLALVDRILAEPIEGEALAGAHIELETRRNKTAAEIAAVLSEVGRLRLQLGLLALASPSGSSEPSLRSALEQLLARARALDEVEGSALSRG